MWFFRIIHWLAFRARVYLAWSRVYRWLWHRKYRAMVGNLGNYKSPTIDFWQSQMLKLTWTPDTWRALRDACGDPHRFQQFVQWANDTEDPVDHVFWGIRRKQVVDLDCDDFAAYGAKMCHGPGVRTCVLSVAWTSDKQWLPEGHAVALVEEVLDDVKRYHHIGNWGRYGPFDSLDAAVASILQGRDMVGWALFTADLTLIDHGFGAVEPDYEAWDEVRWNE